MGCSCWSRGGSQLNRESSEAALVSFRNLARLIVLDVAHNRLGENVDRNNIILSGLPRSGSTLTCHLINKLPNAVALDEPMEVFRFKELPDRQTICDEISQFFASTRRSLQESRRAISKHTGGFVPANHVGAKRTHDGLRIPAEERGKIVFDKPLSSDCMVVVKHISAFAALMPELVNRFPTYVTIRNPVAVLSSWNSVSMPFRNGHAPAAENIDPELYGRLASIPERLDRQVYLLSWFFEQFNHLSAERIIRYEDLVASGGKCLRVIAASAEDLQEPLQNRNRSSLYNLELTPILADRLLRARNGAFWKFYSRESVEAFKSP